MLTSGQSIFLRFSFTDNGVSNALDGTTLGSLLLFFPLLYASVVLTLLFRGTVLLLHVQDNVSWMLIGVFGTGDRLV